MPSYDSRLLSTVSLGLSYHANDHAYEMYSTTMKYLLYWLLYMYSILHADHNLNIQFVINHFIVE